MTRELSNFWNNFSLDLDNRKFAFQAHKQHKGILPSLWKAIYHHSPRCDILKVILWGWNLNERHRYSLTSFSQLSFTGMGWLNICEHDSNMGTGSVGEVNLICDLFPLWWDCEWWKIRHGVCNQTSLSSRKYNWD